MALSSRPFSQQWREGEERPEGAPPGATSAGGGREAATGPRPRRRCKDPRPQAVRLRQPALAALPGCRHPVYDALWTRGLRSGKRAIGHDKRTERYFQDNTPEYSLGRYRDVVEFLRIDAGAGASLLDVGCGTGNVLKLLAENTPINELAGMDISRAYLDQCGTALPSSTMHLASLLDANLAEVIGRRYRYVMVGAVLHHLVGESRSESLAHARRGLLAAWSLIEPEGRLILMEPTFQPHWAMTALFHVKRLVSKVSSGRVSLFGYWNNLGEPIVSYFSHAELAREAAALAGAELLLEIKMVRTLPAAWRLVGVSERADSVLVLRKPA